MATSGCTRAADIAAIQARQEADAVLGIPQRRRRPARLLLDAAEIAERAQALQRIRIRRCSGGAGRRPLSKRRLETMTQLGDACGVRIREVRQFRWIVLQVVQLGTRRLDQLESRRRATSRAAPIRARAPNRATRRTTARRSSGARQPLAAAIGLPAPCVTAGRRSRAASAARRSAGRPSARRGRAAIPGPAMIQGTRRVASYTKRPCAPSPCSPRLSPWSAVTSTIVLPSSPRCSIAFSTRASSRSTEAISPS